MVNNERKEKVLALYLGNPYWKEYYETAPSESCKEYIELSFLFSGTHDESLLPEMKEIKEKKFSLPDWEHLLKYSGNNPGRGQIMREIEKLKAGKDA